MHENLLTYLASTRTLIAGHPVQSILGLGLIFALSSAVGETILYWMARIGGRPLIFRYSRWLRVDARKIDKLEALYARWGAGLVFFGRFLPGWKSLLALPAGMSRMNYGAFIGASFSAAYIYNIAWFTVAIFLGHKITMFGIPLL